MQHSTMISRRLLIAGLGATALAVPLSAKAQILGSTGLGSGLTSLLGKASDSSLEAGAAARPIIGDEAAIDSSKWTKTCSWS